MNIICLNVMLYFPTVFLILLGTIYIFKKDWAWTITERMLKTVKPQRTSEWELYSTLNGVFMLIGGLVIILFIISKSGIGR